MGNQFRKIIGWLRAITPDRVRWVLGPYIAYAVYLFRVYILTNKDAPRVLTASETLEIIARHNLSVIRFGDGEMTVMGGNNLGFQKSSPLLARRLKEIIRLNLPGLLICVPNFFGKLEGLAHFAFTFALHHQFRYRHEWLDLLSKNQIYGDTGMTRPYLGYQESARKHSGELFHKIFSLWRGKNVVLIEGSKSRVGVGNDLLKDAASIRRILCPPENAFDKYDQILNEALKVSKDKLILLSLGPTAKVLGFDLFKAGYRVVDIGHVDMEYEMFIRKERVQTKVKYKYFNEINERNPEDCNDPEYLNQIVARIL